MSPSLLITGGAGFLGINLVRFCLARDWQVTVLDTAPFDYPEREGVHVIQGDIRDTDTVHRAAAGMDFMVHAAAALPLYSTADIMATDVGGTEICLQAARRAGIDRVVYISSTAVYGIPSHHPVRETDPRIGVGPYGLAKIRAEDLCVHYRGQGMCIPVLRPKSFIGPERLGIFGLLYDWAASGKHFPLPGGGRYRFQLLDVADLCQTIWLALTADAGRVNQEFNIGAGVFGTLREDFQTVLDYAGFGQRVIALPAQPAVFLLDMAHRLRLSPIYPWVYRSLLVESWVSVEQARQHLGFVPRYSNREALLRNFEWYMARPASRQAGTGLTHRELWKQGVLSLAKFFF